VRGRSLCSGMRAIVGARCNESQQRRTRRAVQVTLLIAILAVFATGWCGIAKAAGTGHIGGTVTKHGGGALANAAVTVYEKTIGYWQGIGSASTNGQGAYDLSGLDSGVYRVGFHDGSGTCLDFYYSGAATVDQATDVVLGGSETKSGIGTPRV
jgi:hypothetical protein